MLPNAGSEWTMRGDELILPRSRVEAMQEEVAGAYPPQGEGYNAALFPGLLLDP
jgi:hypothetical protein